jgi:hypothetical protein
LTEQRDLQLHEVVPLWMHQEMQVLELASLLPAQVSMVLLQLHERLVVFAELTQQLESMAELEPVPPDYSVALGQA